MSQTPSRERLLTTQFSESPGMNDAAARAQILWIAALLAGWTLVTFLPAFEAEFILFDDHDYVTQNALVLQGLSWRGVLEAFHPSTVVAGNWHPLTLVSHMLDVELFGVNAAAHHATSVVIHALSAAVLFVWLTRMTAQLWPSFLVAALFACHPLRAESVAWIAERKDVLSTLLAMLTLWAYSRYVRHRTWPRYLLVVALFILGLLAKPMLVTLPLVLLMLDFWPLGRFDKAKQASRSDSRSWTAGPFGLLVEKIPLLALSAASALITLSAQGGEGAIASLERISPAVRLINAAQVVWLYIAKTVWPVRLAPFYPLTGAEYSIELGIVSFIAIVAVSVFIVRCASRWPHLPVGWFWYLVTLLPVLGIVQVGSARMADRYTYLPSVGLALMAVWSVHAWAANRPVRQRAAIAASALCLLLLSAATWRQVALWKDTVTLFQHAVAVTSENYFAYNTLGTGYVARGQFDTALVQFDRAIEILPEFSSSHYNRGVALSALGRHEEALAAFAEAERLGHGHSMCQLGIGMTLVEMGKYEDAVAPLESVIEVDPTSFEAIVSLAKAHAAMAAYDEAVRHYRRALELRPTAQLPMIALARLYATSPDGEIRDAGAAVELAARAVKLSGGQNLYALDTLAAAHAEAGDFDQAVQVATAAQELARRRLANQPNSEQLARRLETLIDHVAQFQSRRPLRETPNTAPW